MKDKEISRGKRVEYKCPAGYSINTGRAINMLGVTELWQIFEKHAEPHLIRVPQDFVPNVMGNTCAATVPVEWGKCLYWKTV